MCSRVYRPLGSFRNSCRYLSARSGAANDREQSEFCWTDSHSVRNGPDCMPRSSAICGGTETVTAHYDARSKLKRHVDRLVGEQSNADLLLILPKSRFVLEQDKALKLSLPSLSLYCDWTQHVRLDRNEHGWAVLERLDMIMTGHSQQDAHAVVQQALQLGQLRTELGDLFTQVGASTRLVTEQGNWAGFLGVLLNDLCDRTIEWMVPRNKKAQTVYNRMIAARSGRGRADVTSQSLALDHKDDGYDGPGFYFSVVFKQDGSPYDTTVVGLLYLTSART
jgi:hypothetical protein